MVNWIKFTLLGGAEDLPRLKAEWFQDQGDEIIYLLEQTKGNRQQQRTTHYRPDAIANWRRMNNRRPKGLSMLVEVQKRNKAFRDLQQLLIQQIRQEYQKTSGGSVR